MTILADTAQWADDVDVAAQRAVLESAEPGSAEFNHAHALVTAAENLHKQVPEVQI